MSLDHFTSGCYNIASSMRRCWQVANKDWSARFANNKPEAHVILHIVRERRRFRSGNA